MQILLRFVVFTQAVQIQPEQTLRQSPQNNPLALANTTALRQMPDRCMVLAFGRVMLLTNDQASLHATYLVLYFFATRNSKSNKLCPDSAVKRAWHLGFRKVTYKMHSRSALITPRPAPFLATRTKTKASGVVTTPVAIEAASQILAFSISAVSRKPRQISLCKLVKGLSFSLFAWMAKLVSDSPAGVRVSWQNRTFYVAQEEL